MSYTTPGVYVKEISTLPPSVAEVSTAIPAFIGYTEKGPAIPTRVSTLLEYEDRFGGPQPARFKVTVATTADGTTSMVVEPIKPASQFLLYYAITHFFANGGGSCYISSAGAYGQLIKKDDLDKALTRLEQEDEPTLIVQTDAVNLGATDYHELYNKALAQCKKLGDRFSILDVPGGPENVGTFRSGVTKELSYGAAYTPYLQTSLSYQYEDEEVEVQTGLGAVFQKAIKVSCSAPPPRVKIIGGTATDFRVDDNVLTITVKPADTGSDVVDASAGKTPGFELAARTGPVIPGDYGFNTDKNALIDQAAFTVTYNSTRTVTVKKGAGALLTFEATNAALTIVLPSTATDAPGTAVVTAWNDWKKGNKTYGFDIVKDGEGGDKVKENDSRPLTPNTSSLAALKSENTALYYQIKARLAEERVVLPPSAAVAGIYASVDRDRGVWKAPANVPVDAIIGPTTRITDEEQGRLNVDPGSGKSINAIRAFTGKGTLVWGARTLDGNSNEWRYVPVRRLFIMIEESAKRATTFAVFEPNTVTTWLKVKGMIESFLYSLWERGALAGSTPEQAYFVNVGLGKTMTAQDILEGRMKVRIGIAAARPAEFIILEFTHKLQEV